MDGLTPMVLATRVDTRTGSVHKTVVHRSDLNRLMSKVGIGDVQLNRSYVHEPSHCAYRFIPYDGETCIICGCKLGDNQSLWQGFKCIACDLLQY